MSETTERPRDDAGRFTGAAEHRAVEISSAMSAAVDKDARPADAFQPMKMAEPAPPKEENFSDSVEGLRAAADELQKRRQQDATAPTPRLYQDVQTSVRRPPTETRKLSEAATDLKNLRIAERDAAETLSNLSLAQRIDHFRTEQDKLDRGEPLQAEQVEPPAPQPESEPVPQQPTNGVDPEVAEALKNPKVRAALQEEATAHATARAQYLQSVQQLGNLQTAAMLAEFPELAASGNPRGTLELMRVSNPERFAAISGRLSQIQQTVNHWNGLQQQQHQQQAQQFEGYSKAQDNEYDAFLKTRPAHEAKVVQQNLQGMFDSYGIDVRALEQLYRSSPVVRSAQFQKMAHDLALFHAARQASSQRGADPNIPRVFTLLRSQWDARPNKARNGFDRPIQYPPSPRWR